jgi:hypothetical protein
MEGFATNERRGFVAPIVAGVAAGTLILWLMAAAMHAPAAHGLKVALVAPDQAAAAITASLDQKSPGAFSIVRCTTAEDARAALDDRAVSGAVVMGHGTADILVASGDSEASAAAIGAAFAAVAKATGATATVTDVHPLPASDPHGIVPFFLVLAVSVSGLLYGVIGFLFGDATKTAARVASMIVFAIADGLLVAGVVGFVTGFDSSQWLLAGICMLLALAVAASTVALQRLVGIAGTGVSALFVVILGMATSGGMVGPAFLADGFRELAGLLPPAAGLSAARGAMFFGGGGLVTPVAILTAWIVVAIVVTFAAERLPGRGVPMPVAQG